VCNWSVFEIFIKRLNYIIYEITRQPINFLFRFILLILGENTDFF